MLNEKQKEKLRKIKIYQSSEVAKIFRDPDKDMLIPSFENILDIAFEQLLKNEFSKVERVAPDKANCIIRIYRKRNFEYESALLTTLIHLYGADFFILEEDGKWLGDNFEEINPSEHIVQHYISPYRNPIFIADIPVDFFDVFVKIS